MPKISIIVPVYNVEKYLRRCVDSILAQTFTDFELILVDDGSKDNSGAVCAEYAEKNSRVIVIHKENGGVSSARNAGLERANGTYIMFCDSDDFVTQSWTQKLYQLISKDEVDLAVCRYRKVSSGDMSHSYEPIMPPSCTIMQRCQCFDIWRMGIMQSVWNKIFKRSIICENHIRFDQSLSHAEDTLFVFEYLQKMHGKIGVIENCEYFYFTGHVGSLTQTYIPDCWEIARKYIKQATITLQMCGVDMVANEKRINTELLLPILETISNLLSPNNVNGLAKKLSEGQKILNSEEYKKILKNCEIGDIHPVYGIVLKSRCFLLVWMFYKAVEWKRRIVH